ncbi:mannose-1-phosphate guanylyltransferase/mannose-6-phosphate isomerase [Granulosicoccus antarcticus]|uniref:mannose-1-phosphate guanylyltransferase n=1 Tax=Granulosicoccus antarcticus IMCC3135 TaxID=1192854 RepID=A0A2Z2P220_9GAMM|nr:mannose-1-phosphate guanylyltransferase/mannose-6-phosphate isomerase [Granulosicoccus antarcticus]ASJ74557.1 Alginate biosynthesis protein AlgA [Granulosicoccus antarcticus IMCC3135]
MTTKKSAFVPVILAGGSGTRLWPLSRTDQPKQFLTLGRDLSLIQSTVARFANSEALAPLVVCSERHRFLAVEQLTEVLGTQFSIVLEPAARNTAPAIASAAWQVMQNDPDAVMVVLPADHIIDDAEDFLASIERAVTIAQNGALVTLGIEPTSPETGYGYIQSGDPMDDTLDAPRIVNRFVEKPDRIEAQRLIASGNCFWNAGIFIFKASVFLDSLKKLELEMHEHTRVCVENATLDLEFVRLEAESFNQCQNISVDYAVMERADNVVVLPYKSGWSDIGSWDAVHKATQRDADGNSGVGDILHHDTQDTYLHSSSRLVVAIGTRNISVIETSDAVLVIDHSNAQSIKAAIEHLKSQKRTEIDTHTVCYRPWGHYESLNLHPRFQVKRISVKPGAKLSLQKHFHRSEHWVVVSGTAIVTNGEKEILLTENESTYIPLGTMHRLHNPGTIALELIEVQTGSYLGEDDIVRVGDEYGRA